MILKRLLLIFLLVPFLINSSGSLTYADTKPIPQVTPFESEISITSKPMDPRAQILQAYFAAHNSPAINYSEDFVDAADKYNLDWKLVPAISGVESTFCQFIPGGHNPNYSSYNCWGWGVYGNQAHGFKSFKDGIYVVSEGLRANYFNKGLTNPLAINKVYAASPTWGTRVNFFLSDLDKFEKQYDSKQEKLTTISEINLSDQTAGPSAIPNTQLSLVNSLSFK